MESFAEYMHEYRRQLRKGSVQKAYRGLMQYLMRLRTHFQARYPEHAVSGSLYAGHMDMTFFTVAPRSFRQRGLKLVVVFLHEPFRFEIWLAGRNKKAQVRYWDIFREGGWEKDALVPSPRGVDAIFTHVATDNPDFTDPEALTERIEQAALNVMADVEEFLSCR